MIIESIIGGFTVIVVASIWLAVRITAPDTKPDEARRKMFVEKRRVLERERAEWLASGVASKERTDKTNCSREISRIDAALLALAAEEAKAELEAKDVHQ